MGLRVLCVQHTRQMHGVPARCALALTHNYSFPDVWRPHDVRVSRQVPKARSHYLASCLRFNDSAALV
jgi:hypothetical protein